MADVTLNIVIPDAWVSRVQSALGVSTKTQAEEWIRTRIKEHVVAYETTQAETTAQTAVDTALANQKTAVDTAIANANTLNLG